MRSGLISTAEVALNPKKQIDDIMRLITIAAVRPLEEVLRREAAKHQTEWQREAGVIGKKAEDRLVLFLSSLLDNKSGWLLLPPPRHRTRHPAELLRLPAVVSHAQDRALS